MGAGMGAGAGVEGGEEARIPRRAVRKFRQPTSSEGSFTLQENTQGYDFTKIGGYDEVKAELLQVVDFFLNSAKYSAYDLRTPKGLLLEGPSGNGKTLFARCLAGETNSSFIATVGSEFNEKYVGVGAARVRELFNFAKANQPCIIFIDEIDAIGRKRSGGTEGSDSERDQTLNQLLSAMDGFVQDSVLIVGATNRIDVLDSAIKRPGRFDKIIHVPNPDAEAREEIIKIHLGKKPIEASVEEVVRMTAGLSGAQIENLLNEATLMALRRDTLPVGMKVLEEAKERLTIGNIVKKRKLKDNTLQRIAVHEMGHFLSSLRSKVSEKPVKVSIDVMSSNALGVTIFEHVGGDVDDGLFTLEFLEERLCVLLGGRIAEEVVFGTSVSSGALSDLESAFLIAKQMVMNYGMGKKIIYPYFSEQYKNEIDDEIHYFINNAHRQTMKYLEEHKMLLLHLSKALFDCRTMTYDEVVAYIHQFNAASAAVPSNAANDAART
jgi:cell division protease FtsH